MIVLRRNTMLIVLTVVICACLYDHMAEARDRTIRHSELAQALLSASSAVQKNDFLFTPFKLIFRLIDFLFRAVTYPFRFVYRLVFNFIAVFALLMMNCKVIPETSCPNRAVEDVIEDIVQGIKDELEFLATMDVNA